MTQLILASTSPYRKEILEKAGLKFLAVAPLCDEDQLKDAQLNSTALTLKLAEHKAKSLKAQHPHDVIIGSDQVLDFNGKIFGKPHTREAAITQLCAMSGQTHSLVTSLFICGPNNLEFAHTDITKLKMRNVTQKQIEDYVDWEQPFDCAGSYKIEKRGISLFETIDTQDFHSIQGLPIIALLNILEKWQLSFWKTTGQNPADRKMEMLQLALKAQQQSYSPYSTKKIASSILWNDGSITTGCNIENASYGATVCAERVAIWNGLSANSKRRINAVLVLSDASPPWPPCGMCRQVISEFAGSEVQIYLANPNNEWVTIEWKDLFPMGFTPEHLS